ncbi:MAG: hypothetical protein C6W57_03935 [Caldibacillus debilis]|nr:MAG: hypothetical protein C6W57_03935 [Caldibacillus debilis]
MGKAGHPWEEKLSARTSFPAGHPSTAGKRRPVYQRKERDNLFFSSRRKKGTAAQAGTGNPKKPIN